MGLGSGLRNGPDNEARVPATPEADDGTGHLLLFPRTRGASSPAFAIRARNLTREFPGVRAVDGVSLNVPRGTVFGFLGRNGAGKTTMIRLLLGLLEPTGGRSQVLGFDSATRPDEVRKRCGVLLEHSGLIERVSALDNLDIYGRIWRLPRGVRDARIVELLQRLELWDRRSEKVRMWSRGMKQKLAIARAMIHHPAVLFLDEPTAGLDPVAAAELGRTLTHMASREGVTVFLNTHNLREAEKLCDMVGVIRQGRLLAVGTPDDLRSRRDRRRFRISGRGLTLNVADLVSERHDVAWVVTEGDCLLVDLQDNARISPLVAFLVRVGVELEEVTPIGSSLEDTFHSLMTGEIAGDGSRPGSERFRSA
jgi:ABC-2 type transport system ATP-binding protein